ncbi:alpha/beta hydrolase fold protein [Crinalium epipsammum PCC 9333]|uniref:Alpha/beta hydrolase fold protein n=1 Tax=Crinalium epipsammum PCC 9333 TaxID=1173022 RepID=K9VZE1_9CYAN|nr:alpha/beta hydrolase [Crinalium epipsammum]AFZ12867.1 alpha/beta hydrolase fold protein [Crinalium epipsammum PCC 9333]
MPQPLSNSRIRLSQGQIFWREVGTGPTLVFLHGSWSDGSQWIPIIERLSSNYHCLVPDLLGFGDSERRKIHYSIELEVECLAEFLASLNQRHIYLIGHSLGGWIAASFALKHPEKVRGMVLLAPVGLQKGKARTLGWLTRLLLLKIPMGLWLARSIKPLASVLGKPPLINQTLKYRQLLLNSPTTCKLFFQRNWSEIQAELLHLKLESLQVPTLILQGGRDTMSAIAQSKAYADLIPTSEHHIISIGENDLPQQFPAEVVQYIRDFIKYSVVPQEQIEDSDLLPPLFSDK